MKKQITLVLSAMLFTGYICAQDDVAPVVPAETPEIIAETPAPTENPVIASEGQEQTSATEGQEQQPVEGQKPDNKVEPAPKKLLSMPTIAQLKSWCAHHKLIVGGTAAAIGFVVLWKTCPAFRAFFGVEDEQEQKAEFVY